MITIPELPIVVKKPKTNVSEAQKFANGGEWFADQVRWHVLNYYNTYSSPSNDLWGGSMVGEMTDSYRFYYGYQDNSVFSFLTKTYGGGDVPAVWINGQDVSQFVKNMQGNIIDMVKPMAKNISAESISKNTVIKKKEIFDKIAIAAEINGLLEDMPVPMPYAPAGEKNYQDKGQVKDALNKVKKQFEKIGTTFARNVFYTNDLQTQLVEDGVHQVISNLCGTHIYEKNGQIINDQKDPYCLIYDFSSKGQFAENTMFAGFIEPATYDEACEEFDKMEDKAKAKKWKDEISNVAAFDQPNFRNWTDHYNAPFTNVQWWYNNQKYISKAVLYFLEKKDMRFQSKENAYGKKKIRKIDDYKSYPQTDETGKIVDSKMGYEVEGDKKTWMVHKCTLWGNKYPTNYGYETFQVRPPFAKDKPQLPIFTFCHDKMAGMVRSIVSRLKPNQRELDRLAYKIQSLTSQDLGKVFFVRGDKYTEAFSPKGMIDDAKAFKIVVVPPTGDEGSDRLGIQDMVNAVDMSNNVYINQYVELRREQREIMHNITSVSPPALGMLQRTTGKAVNESEIAQSTLGVQGLYYGLQEFWRRKICYSANKLKLVVAQKPDTVHVLPVSNKDVEVIKVTKDYRFEDLFVYIEENDAIEVTDKAILHSMIQAYSQNSQNPVGAAQAMLNSLKLLKFDTFQEGVDMLEEHLEEITKQADQQMQQQTIIQNQEQQFQAQSNQILEQQKAIAKIYEILLSKSLAGAWQVKAVEAKTAAQPEDEAVIQPAIAQQNALNPMNQQAQQ